WGLTAPARIPATAPLEPSFEPQVQHVVQIDVRQQRAEHPTGNVANRPHEFVVRITRRKLRPSYGDGFAGAPLRSAAVGQSRRGGGAVLRGGGVGLWG